MTLWPDILEDCFAFVANYQMFSSEDALSHTPITLIPHTNSATEESAESKIASDIAAWTGPLDLKKQGNLQPIIELYYFIKENSELARKLETAITKIANE